MTASAKSHLCSPRATRRPARRSTLRIGTALAGGLVGLMAATAVSASTLPTGGAFALGTGTFTSTATTSTITTTAGSGIVTWTTFDVPVNNTVTFKGCVSCTILNRVTTAAASVVDGTITATGVNVWLVNGAGITFSSTGKFNGGSLVLSTLQDNITTASQLNGTAASEFTTANGLLAMNGTITSTGSVLLVGKTVSVGTGAGDRIAAGPASGALPADNPVVMIASSDVAFPAGPGSPLSYLIKGGTAVAANQMTVNGAIKGTSLVIGAMSPSVANTALLQIASTGSLTATADGGKVTISTDNNVSATHDASGLARSAFDQVTFAGGTAAQTTGTNGSINVFGPAVLTGNTTLVSTGTGATTFAGTVDGGKTLTVTGDAEFDGVVGGAIALTSTDVSGKTKIVTTGITTTGAQTYTGAITLGANTTLTITGNGNVALGGVTGGGKTLTVGAGTGAVNVTGQIGTTAQPLGAVSLTGGAISLAGVDASALTLTNSGVLTLNTGDYTIGAAPYTFTSAATTNGTLTLGQDTTFGALTLVADAVLDGSAGNHKVTLAKVHSAVDGASGLTVKTGTALATLGGVVGGGTKTLAFLDVTGPSAINTTTIRTKGDQSYTGAVTLGANATLTSTANGTIKLGTVTGAGKSLDVQTGTGAIALHGVTGTTALTLASTSLTLNTGTYTPNAGSPFTFGAATTNGTLTLGQITAFGALTLGSDTTITSAAGNFNQVLGAVTGASHALVVNAGTGAIALNGVNGTAALSLTRNLLTLNTGTYDVDAGAAFNFGAATTNGTLTLKQKTTFGAITLGSDTIISDPLGYNTYYSTIDGAHAFAVNAFGSALIVINGHVGTVATPLTSVKLTGTTQLNGGSVFTQGVQTYTGAFNVGAATTLDSSAGNGDIGFSSVLLASIASPQLTIKAGTGAISAGGQIGTIAYPYGAVSLTGGKITLAGVDAGSLTLTNSSTLALNTGDYTIGPAPYTFTGAATTNGTLTLGQDTTFSGALTLASTTTLDSATGNHAITLAAADSAVDGASGLTVKTGTALATFGGVVGGSKKLASLETIGPSAINTPAITTKGDQTYTGATALGANTTLTSTANGTVKLAGVTGAGQTLDVAVGTGAITFNGQIGTAALPLGAVSLTGGAIALTGVDASALTLTNSGVLTLDTGDYTIGTAPYTFGAVTTSGTLALGQNTTFGAVTLGSDTTITSAAGNFSQTLGAVTGGSTNLTANSGTGAITFGGQIGTTALPLGAVSLTGGAISLAGVDSTALTLTNSGVLTLGTGDYTIGAVPFAFGAATTNGTLTLGQDTTFGALTLGTATTLDGSIGNRKVTLAAVDSAVDGASGLTVKTGTAQTVLGGVVGATKKLASLDVSGTSQINTTAITTTGNQTFAGAVTLGANTTLTSTANGTVKLAGVTGAGNTLGVAAGTGTITVSGPIGTVAQPLGAVSLAGGAISLVGVDASALTLTNSGVLTLGTGNYTIGAAPYTFGAATANGTLTLGQSTTFVAATLATDTTITSAAGNFNQTLGAVTGGGNQLTVNAGTGLVLLNGVAGTSALTLIAGGLTLNTGVYDVDLGVDYTFGAATTNGTLTLLQKTTFGALALGSGTTLNSSVGNHDLVLSTVNGSGKAFTVNAGSGAVTVNGQIGTTALPLDAVSLTGGAISLVGADASALTLANSGVLTLGTGDYTIGAGPYTFGAATTNGTLTLGQDTSFGALTLATTTILDASGANHKVMLAKVDSAVDGVSALTVKTGTAQATFGGLVGGTKKLATLAVTGPATISTSAITTTGAQDYQGAVTLLSATTLDSSAGNGAITFEQTLDGAFDLTTKAGTGQTTFDGLVGGSAKLASLTVTGQSVINTTAISTTGAQDYQDAVTLLSATTLDSSSGNGAITFEKTLDGGFGLTTKAGTGLTTFSGAVGATTRLSSLTVTGISAINGGGVSTVNGQSYQGAAKLGAATTLDSTTNNGTITFGGTLDGGFDLTAKAGTALTTFAGTVGATTKLKSLTVTGTSAINGGSVTTTDAQDYQDAVTLGAATTLDSSANNGAITFHKTLDGAFDLTTKAGTGLTTFDGVVGGNARLSTLTVAGKSKINTTAITTTGLQDYQDAVTLASVTTLDSSAGNGAITFEQALDGGFDLTTKAGTATTKFAGVVGGNAALATLAVTGPATISTSAITTTGAQDYQGAVTLGAGSTLTGSTVTFGSKLDGAFGLKVQGNGVFDASVGSGAALSTLTVTGTGLIQTTDITTTGAQNWQGAVTLASASTLTTGSDATFGATIDGAQALTVTAKAGKANFNGVVGGGAPLTSLTVTATGAGINAAINAGAISLNDSGAAGTSLRLGDLAPFTGAGTAGAGDFVLSTAAIANLKSTGTLRIDASQVNKPNVITGNFTIAGSVKTLDIYGLSSVFVWGKIDAAGTGLTGLEIGGDGTAASLAKQLTVIATPGTAAGVINGGAIATPSAAVALKADAIAVGQDLGFLSVLGMKPGGTISSVQAQGMINNPASSLYSTVVGGGSPYLAKDIVVAKSLSVRFSNFALFQNTAVQGQNSGITLATSLLPSTPALTVFGGGTTNTNPFAVFGTIDGVGGIPTALLGGAVISATQISVPVSRINGCVIGSSAGCITAAALSTTLQAVDPSRVTLFYANTDYVVAFDPLVGTNNEALFNDFGSLGVGDVREPAPACKADDKTCPEHQKGAH